MASQFFGIYDRATEKEFPATIINNKVYILNDKHQPVPPKKYLWKQLSCTRKKFFSYTNKLDEGNIKVGIFDLNSGAIIVYPKYEEIADYYGSIARIKVKNKYGFIDLSGNIIVEAIWDYADVRFSENLCVVKMKDKYGYVDSKGKIKIPLRYDWAERFRSVVGYDKFNMAARVKKEGNYGFITTKGEYIIY